MARCFRCKTDLGQGGVGQEDGTILCSECDRTRHSDKPQYGPFKTPWKLYAGIVAGAFLLAVVVGMVMVSFRNQEKRLLEENQRKEAAAQEREQELREKIEESQRQALEQAEQMRKDNWDRELRQKQREQELLAQVQTALEKQQADRERKQAEELRDKERLDEIQRKLAELEAKKRELELTSRLQSVEAQNISKQQELQKEIEIAKKDLQRKELERQQQEVALKRRERELQAQAEQAAVSRNDIAADISSRTAAIANARRQLDDFRPKYARAAADYEAARIQLINAKSGNTNPYAGQNIEALNSIRMNQAAKTMAYYQNGMESALAVIKRCEAENARDMEELRRLEQQGR